MDEREDRVAGALPRGRGPMSSSRLEEVVVHPGRLGLLRCLLDDGPSGASRLSARIGEPLALVHYWIKLLESCGLVRNLADPGARKPLYAVTLDEQPDWVRETVEGRR